jgi:aspartyl-tRNA(Asn)/glutamyl-tRNA(Gln) amidotransferase subunit A
MASKSQQPSAPAAGSNNSVRPVAAQAGNGAHRAFIVGDRSAHEIVADTLAAIDASQPKINAFAYVAREQSLKAAAALDAAALAGHPPGLLAAVPVSVKDIINTMDMPTQWGSLLMQGQTPAADAVAVQRLRSAGAVIVGKTTTSDFAYKLLTDSMAHGVTRNPWNTDYTPGGSSGGAAASVAAGLTDFALATDAGASTRLPAACCGILGMKPTLGLIPHNQVPDGFNNFVHIGLMARRAADLALYLDVLAGPHPSDPHSLGVAHPNARAAVASPLEPKKLRIGWLALAGNAMLDPEVERGCHAVLARLEADGAVVEHMDLRIDNPGVPWRVLQQSNWASRWFARLEEVRDRIEPGFARGIADGGACTGPQLMAAIQKRTEIFRMVQGWFGKFDLIATPTMSAPAVLASHPVDAPLVIGGKALGDLREEWIPYLNLFNLSSHPAISIPCGLSGAGLPMGIQFAAPWYADSLLIRLAAWLEVQHPWPGAPDAS